MDGVAVDAMDWGPGAVVEGTAEADDAKLALISAVLKQDGAGAAQAGESEASCLWRCGTLRHTEPGAAPMLRKAMEVASQQQLGVLALLLPAGAALLLPAPLARAARRPRRRGGDEDGNVGPARTGSARAGTC